MKQLLSILLAVSILFLGLGKSVLVLNYQINKKEIVASKCENRDKPQMHCNGHCYLSKQLKQAEEKETALPNFNNLKELSPFITPEAKSVQFLVQKTHIKIEQNHNISFPIEACPGSIFQPPEHKA